MPLQTWQHFRGSSAALTQLAQGGPDCDGRNGDPLTAAAVSSPSTPRTQGWKALGSAPGAKTLMTFRGTPQHMGCTILLKVLCGARDAARARL